MLAQWRRWRRSRVLAQRPIPDALWRQALERYPFIPRRRTRELERLREFATLFLARKEFSGAHGFEVTDEIAVAIAAQACIPVLELGLECYDGFVGIVVHADAVAAQRETTDEHGVVHKWVEELSGETMAGGPLMLSWQDVAEAGASADWGYNVVIHEFVHVLDRHAGQHGLERLPRSWAAGLREQYERFVARVEEGEDTLLDPYGSTAIEEFLAVAAEVFFVAPADLLAEEPALYRLLQAFFRQDPVQFARA